MKAFHVLPSNQVSHNPMKFILLIIIVASFGCSSIHKASSFSSTEIDLKRRFNAGENHLYGIHLNAGEFLYMQVVQYGMDVIAKVYSKDKRFAEQFD